MILAAMITKLEFIEGAADELHPKEQDAMVTVLYKAFNAVTHGGGRSMVIVDGCVRGKTYVRPKTTT
jgi:hypothetical protein